MDLSMDSLTPFSPEWGEIDEWNDAYEKLENYLRAHGVESQLYRAQLITTILGRVNDREGGHPVTSPISALAIIETNLLLNEWFSIIMNQPVKMDGKYAKVDGRVALYLCNSSTRWPYAFLQTHHVPPEMAAAMRDGLMHTGPELQVSSMVPRPIDLGRLPSIADDAFTALHRAPLIKTLIGWAIFLGVLLYLFWYTR
jgi:hypothetical protein